MISIRPRRILWEGGWLKRRVRYVVDFNGWHHFQIRTDHGWEEGHDTDILGVLEEALAPLLDNRK